KAELERLGPPLPEEPVPEVEVEVPVVPTPAVRIEPDLG
ncbi:MAG: hypothetical protein QOJ16_3828, partial [Acidobacteriota bacterium]|nr:hypothetical protein [Acidobacteriota bacterium]